MLTGQIREAFGSSPTAFRAGRYGCDARVAKRVAEEGFVVDSSVTPSDLLAGSPGMGGGGPDFSRFTVQPFRVAGTGTRGSSRCP